MIATRSLFAGLTLFTVTGLTALVSSPAADAVAPAQDSFDVAMDGSSFHFEGATTPNGVPADGTPFVISGYIYPGGTFERHGDLSGVDANGDPTFPELVVGEFICRGWHKQDGDATTGVIAVTTQTFDFDLDHAGEQMVVTNGIELADFNTPFKRPVTGGSGFFAGRDLVCEQVMLGGGFNPSGGFNASFEFMTID
ncbi:hypothetical protein [Engelhardtia mirabilis]|uniref:Uncharacterized protein n=1 Tax=Engelhardtia mirabilis TaxID=2528011 RepID=A0A518BFA5_9BACT|nr:hypothetical protein Pla133_07290 [Planctomycetes bacterium Pla133]QDU99989.1 hypothetical protein Pla86_07280 [Planctomycetes bacterium Pla86]